jgi:Ca2+-binding EF-hand superfamily protein
MGDADGDGDVDLDDFASFAKCLGGPAGEAPETCDVPLGVFDSDEDGDVDLHDFAAFLSAWG